MNTAVVSPVPCLSAPLIYLWQECTLYIGPLPENVPHSIFLDSLSANLSADFTVTTDDWRTITELRTVFWPGGCVHQSRYHFHQDIMAFILMEPGTPYANIVREAMTKKRDGFYYQSKHEQQIISILKEIYLHRDSSETAYQKLVAALDPEKLCATSYKNYKIDPRIDNILKMLRANPAKNVKVEVLANEVSLSPSRLIHLFKEQTGIPISQMRLWLKLKYAMELLAIRNRTLTNAALAAGFVDTAHFSRAYKALAGMTPSSFFQSGRETQTICSV